MDRFQQARAYTILPVSSTLAALYTQQSSTTPNDLTWCCKCGSYLLNGSAQIRIIRLKRKHSQISKILRATCTVCSWDNDVPCNSAGNARQENLLPPVIPNSCSQPSATPPVPQRSKVKKKKSGLQALLSRSRDKQEQERIDGQVSGGLAAFLEGL